MMTAGQGLAEVYVLGFYGFTAFLLWALAGPQHEQVWMQLDMQFAELEKKDIPRLPLYIAFVLTHTVCWPIAAIQMMAKSGGGDGHGDTQ
jgi:hypothetical protein